MQACWRARELADAGLSGLVPPNAVGIIGRRNHRGFMRHQVHAAFENGNSASN